MRQSFGKMFVFPVMLLTCGIASSAPLAPYPTATLTVGGAEQIISGSWDSGPITVDFNGYLETVRYGQFSSPASLASGLAAMFSRDYNAFGLYAKAGANGNSDPTVITFQLANGSTFGPINIVDASSSFTLTASGFGSSSATVADRGTVVLQLTNDTTTPSSTTIVATTSYGDGSTPATIAEGLALTANSSLVKVTAQGGNVYLESKPVTGSFNYTYSLAFQSTQSGFSSPSFASSPASGPLTGTTEVATVPVYSYSIPSYSSTNSTGQNGYDANGNVLNMTDQVMGSWAYGYDSLNRLTSGVASTGAYTGTSTCWSYDAFGNRKSQSVSSTPCSSSPPKTFSANFGVNNRITAVTSTPAITISYDGAGNVTNDGYNSYLYDAEGRLCAVQGPQGMIGYQYDAEGRRVGKGMIGSMSCDVTANGYLPTTDYVLDQGGGQMTEIAVSNGMSSWQHTNVEANGKLLATFDSAGLHFHLTDPLGSRRVQTDPAGFPEQTCQSLPFGDQLYCTASLTSPTEHHFTGKERDTESGLDYFGARHYGSNMGRFISPDPMGIASGSLENPQSLNLYAYVLNNPLINTDPTGMECVWDDGSYDSEYDEKTGSVGSCQKQGGTWIELGANGGWSANADKNLAGFVSTIANNAMNGLDTTVYTFNQGTGITSYTHFNSSGLVDTTGTSGMVTQYGYSPGSVDAKPTGSSWNPSNILQSFLNWQAHANAQQDPDGYYQSILFQEIAFTTTHPTGKDLVESCQGFMEVQTHILTALSVPALVDTFAARAAYQSAEVVASGKLAGAATVGAAAGTYGAPLCNGLSSQ